MTLTAAHSISRARVTKTLQKALETHQLVVVTAAMGYGKSTAARELVESLQAGGENLPAQQKPARRVLSLATKPGWRNADYMWSSAMESLSEQGAQTTKKLQQGSFPVEAADIYQTLNLWHAALLKTPTVLIIDDYQNIAGSRVDSFLESMVREEIPGFGLVIFSRTRPGIALEDLQLKGHAAVFGQELLAFTPEESRALFSASGVTDIGLADAAQIFSEGWAMALRISLQSCLQGGGVKPARNIEKLINEIFFSSYAEQDQKILLQLSVMDNFTAAQAAILCDDPAAPARLRELYDRNAFLGYLPVDDAYSMHGLFRSYLQDRLAENGLPVCRDIDRPALYKRAAELYLRDRDYLQALKLFAKAGRDEDLLSILKIFETPDEGLFISADPQTVSETIRSIPWKVKLACPVGYLGFIHRYMVRVDRAEAARLLEETEWLFDPETARKLAREREHSAQSQPGLNLYGHSQAGAGLDQTCPTEVAGRYLISGPAFAVAQENPLGTAPTDQEPLAYAAGSGSGQCQPPGTEIERPDFSPELLDKLRGEMELIRAVLDFNDIEAMCGHYQRAQALLRGRSSLVNENMFWTFYCPHSAFLYLRKAGGYKRLLQLARESLPYFDAVSGGANAGAADLLNAEYLLEIGSTFKVLHPLLKAEYKAREAGQYAALLAARFTAARLNLAKGEANAAMESIEEIVPTLLQNGHPLLLQDQQLCRGYLAAVCNRREQIPTWLLSMDQPPLTEMRNRHAAGHNAFILVVQGKAIMAQQDWPRLEAFADSAERRMNRLNSLYGRIHALIFKSIAAMHTHIHNTSRAESYLSLARELAAVDGIVTSIAEYGKYLYPLLQRLLNLHPQDKGLVLLARQTKKYARLDEGLKPRLTMREQDILEKAAAGASNRDIGQELGITAGSVANSLSRIYAKLGVGSRFEAIRKWTGDRLSDRIEIEAQEEENSA